MIILPKIGDVDTIYMYVTFVKNIWNIEKISHSHNYFWHSIRAGFIRTWHNRMAEKIDLDLVALEEKSTANILDKITMRMQQAFS